jgi:hypothetical protein
MTYTNELEVEIDFSDVDPNLAESKDDESLKVLANSEEDSKSPISSSSPNSNPQSGEPNLGLGEDEPKPTMAGRAARFFRKKS